MPIQFKKDIRNIIDEKDLRGKRVLLRLDLNVPIINGVVADDFRINRILPTLEFLRKSGARTIVISHIEGLETKSLAKVVSHLGTLTEIKAFVSDFKNANAVSASMQEGEIIVLENLRLQEGECDNSSIFAEKLSKLADIYVNDAFSVSHREHASIVSVPKFMDQGCVFAGPLFTKEVDELSQAFNPEKPFIFLLGGAKFDTKLPLIDKFLDIADYVFIGGALSNDLFKDRGYEVGKSLVSKKIVSVRHLNSNKKIIIPSDVVVKSSSNNSIEKNVDSINEDEIVMDLGQGSISELSDLMSDAKFILWNGPMGDYENGFAQGTENLAKAIIESKARSIIGGGDTVACVSKAGLLDKFHFVSTGGGAMLDFLVKGTLPGIEALIN